MEEENMKVSLNIPEQLKFEKLCKENGLAYLIQLDVFFDLSTGAWVEHDKLTQQVKAHILGAQVKIEYVLSHLIFDYN